MSAKTSAKSYRLYKVAKELNVGSATLVDYLNKQSYEVENKPTTKLNSEMYEVLLKEFASEKKLKEKASQLKSAEKEAQEGDKPLAKPTKTPAPTPVRDLSVEDLKSNVLEQTQPGKTEPAAKPAKTPTSEPEEFKQPAEGAKTESAPEQVEIFPKEETQPTPEASPEAQEPESTPADKSEQTTAPADKADTTDTPETTGKTEKGSDEPAPGAQPDTPEEPPKVGLKVLGKIDLDQAGKQKGGKTKPAQAATDKPSAKPETPAATAPQTPQPETAEPTPEAAETPQAPAAEAPTADPQTPAAGPAAPTEVELPTAEGQASTTPPTEEGEAETDEEGLVRAGDRTPRLQGLKVLGKIDLPAKDKAKDSRTDTDQGDSADGERTKRKRKRKRKEYSALPDNARTANVKPREASGAGSSQDVASSMRSTLAGMNKGRGRQRQKLRRDRRDQRAQRRQEEMEAQMAEANVLEVTEFLTVSELANLMDVNVNQVIAKCMELGMLVSINQRIDSEVIQLIADEFGYEVRFVKVEEAIVEEDEEDEPEKLEGRSPIVTVMGHVDHGKTSLLDYIRQSNVTEGESGGITQHIGAYEAEVDGKLITFLDTPGHEAFTAMRARGAQVTDLAIIVIAADDQVMPQTREAINHAQAAGVTMVIAINKIDKPGAQPDLIRQQLSEMGILVEDWGGEVSCQEISAKNGQGITELLEQVLITAELMELKANPSRTARGTVIEARLDKGMGVVSTMLVQKGTLRIGDPVLANCYYGKVKAMYNHKGERVKEAGPSDPVQILGLDGVPTAGDNFAVMTNEREAREVANKRRQVQREQQLRMQKHITLEEIARRSALGDFQELNLIIKADVDGSAEALADSLLKLSHEEVAVNIILKGVGQISESDVLLASASNALILGFNVRPSAASRKLAETEGVEIRQYSVIYKAIEEMQDALEGMLSPDIQEKIVGSAEVLETFKISKVGTIAGCKVIEGRIHRKDNIRLIREGVVVYTGYLASLKRFKDDTTEVKSGYECGLNIENFNDLKVGDIIESYETIEIKRTLQNSNAGKS